MIGWLLGPSVARAATHQMCLDFELGPGLFDASPRPPSGQTCNVGQGSDCIPAADPDLAPWESCDNGVCIPKTTDYGEDFGRWEGLRPFDGRGLLARVVDNDTGSVLWGWQPLDGDGCTGVFEDGGDSTNLVLQRARWTVSPAGHSILGYECELDNNVNGMQQEAQDGDCDELLATADAVMAGGPSPDCLSTGADVDHCTQWTVVDDGTIPPIDVNLWAATATDRRTNFIDPTVVYVLQELDDQNNTGTSAGPWLGAHPSVRLKWNQFHERYTPAHEYGHLIAFNIPNAQGGHPTLPGDVDYGAVPMHTVTSDEWHAAAAVEGLANFVALAAWNDLSEDDDVDFLNASLGDDSQLIVDGSIYTHPGDSTPCDDATPSLGQSCELAWGSAMRQILRGPSPASDLETVLLMVSEAHRDPPYTWTSNGANTDFVDNFDAAMSAYLTPAEYTAWTALASTWGLD